MSTSGHIEPEDLALLAMQLLSRDESAAATTHVEHCATCRQQLAEVQGDLALYAHTVDIQSPAAQTRVRLMKQIAREKKVVPVDRAPIPAPTLASEAGSGYRTRLDDGRAEEEPKRSFGSRVFPWIGWAVAAGMAVTARELYRERETMRGTLARQASQMDQLTMDAASAQRVMDVMTDRTAKHVMLTKAPVIPTPPTPQGRATYIPEKGALIFLASNMEPLQPDKVYQLWLIPADDRNPIPAGTFHPDDQGSASVILPSLPRMIEAKAFGVTVENEGGSQTPTLPIIMAGS